MGHALTPAAGMIADWVALLCSVVLLMELPDGTPVCGTCSQRGSGSMSRACIYSCAFLLALHQVVFISVYQPGFFPGSVILLQNTATAEKGRFG